MEGQSRGIVLVLLLSFLFAQVLGQLAPQEPRVMCPAGHPKSWNYNRPGSWGDMCQQYSTCNAGPSSQQSPVNLVSTSPTFTIPSLNLGFTEINLIRVGDLLTMPIYTESSFPFAGRQNYLSYIEFHSPSEHTINGKSADLEVQLYFNWSPSRRFGSPKSVISLLFNRATCDHPFFSVLNPAIPRRSRCECGNNRTENFLIFREECDQGSNFNAMLPGRCRPNCVKPFCGDGVVDPTEECDTKGDTATCTGCKIPRCGDGKLNAGEECDDGNRNENDGCSGLCKKECGDGCLQPNEECDLGAKNSNIGGVDKSLQSVCRFDCRWARCGDGIVDIGEACDAGDVGNAASGPDGCRPNCVAPRCGDGVVDPKRNETCDGGPLCSSSCTLLCGNGVIDGAEQCDAGANNSNAPGAPCRPGCLRAECGDGIVDPNEQCDFLNNPLCFNNCTWRCGNRIIDAALGEQCDNGHPAVFPARANDGNSDTRPNACRMNCQLPSCGDGVIDPVNCEQCDDGANNGLTANKCRAGTCQLPSCGDGIVDNGEECDDGNNVDEDGCSCCRKDCGNGIKTTGEECDDGAANSDTIPNRCRKSCKVHFCGDGLTDYDEECDFNSGKSVGCTAQCKRPFCGDGVVAPGLGEECDNGAANSYADINGCSPICTLNQCGQVLTSSRISLSTLFSGLTEADGSLKTISYVGSETHPPCTENVLWHVVPKIGKISNAQYLHFTNAIYKNSRPAQPFNNRGFFTGASVPRILDPRAISKCGNGIVEQGEQCDNGDANSNVLPNACRVDCRINRCGDGVVDAGEDCDERSPSCANCRFVRRQHVVPRPLATCWSHDGQGIWDSCASNTCNGNLQSPIRLPANICPKARALNLNHPSNVQYNPSPVVLFNDGRRIVLPTLSGGSFNWKGVSYALQRIEFRAPSEHYIGGKQYPLEVQLHHQSQNPAVPRSAVLSVLFQVGASANAFLAPIFDRLPLDSQCRCGNGIKEDVMITPNGQIVQEECDDGAQNSDSLPDRCRTNCRNPYCGDGVVDSCNNEACDSGVLNANLPNRCRTTCKQPYCGDGILDNLFDEQCDDGNNRDGDGCSSQCRRECGNGVIDRGELCDNGISNSDVRPDACRTSCVLPRCGDNVVDYGEECDSGAANSNSVPNACRVNCTKPVCGDKVVDPWLGEECDGGVGCDSNCRKLCGNGVLDDGEICDTGAGLSSVVPNACRPDCTVARCGDGVVDDGEECDEGALNTIRCKACKIVCGNGVLDAGEECDDGSCNSDINVGACRTNCKKSFCGDGVQDPNEECDNGARNANTADACRTTCKVSRCGDGIIDKGETCDDGNTIDGDGCSGCCQLECGNGRIDGPKEQCDAGAGNANTASCCRTNCLLPFCGDGITDNGEECDDGALNGNAPNACRANCKLPRCGDGIVDHIFGEICDQGSRNALFAVDGCAPNCIPNSCRQSVAHNVTVNPQAVLPTTPGTYWYPGSSNQPPCSENVDWFVFSTPQTLSAHQYYQYTKTNLVGATRCLQPRNGRPVDFLEVKSVCGDGITEGNEECDNGPQNSDSAPNACRRNCRRAFCGDGVLDNGEICDGTPNCSSKCQLSCPANGTGSSTGTCSATGTTGTGSTNANVEPGSTINVNFAQILAQ